jgi:hypothetical protein
VPRVGATADAPDVYEENVEDTGADDAADEALLKLPQKRKQKHRGEGEGGGGGGGGAGKGAAAPQHAGAAPA